MVFICLWCFQCPSGGHSFTVGVHKYTARPGMIFCFTLLICIVFFVFFLLSYHLFLFVCLFVCFLFLFPPPPLILGIRSLAGGRREYGRSGREQLFFNLFYFYMLLFWICPYILSEPWVENAAIPTQYVQHFSVFICSHTESGWIRFLGSRHMLASCVTTLALQHN